MDRKSVALQRLRDYEFMRRAVENLRMQLRLLKLTRDSIPGFHPDRLKVKRTPGSLEDRLMEDLLYQQELEKALDQTLLWILITDGALAVLEPDELLLLRLFYIKRTPDVLAQACQLLGAEKSTVYRKRDRALKKFTTALYGAAESKEAAGA